MIEHNRPSFIVLAVSVAAKHENVILTALLGPHIHVRYSDMHCNFARLDDGFDRRLSGPRDSETICRQTSCLLCNIHRPCRLPGLREQKEKPKDISW